MRTTDPDQLLEALDPEQREVATSLGGPVVVIAGAGTGKTRAITHRIAYGVATGVYNPSAVLAVTFTARAAGEMRGRLQQLGAVGVQARTFHSAALRQAQYFWPRAYGGELPQVLDRKMSVVAEAATRLRIRTDTGLLRDLVSEISWAKVSNVSPDEYPRIATQQHRVVASLDAETIGRAFGGYEAAKRDRGRIDFEDILLCAAALIGEHPEVAAEVRRTYRHLVVDEYQDVSPLQEALLTLWRGERSDLCVVGDPAQTIHSFAGAQAHFLTGFARRNPSAKVVRLVRDYRSTPQVVKVANSVMATSGPSQSGQLSAVTLQAQRPSGPEVRFIESTDETTEAAAVAEWFASLAAKGVGYREMAVLYRINAQSPVFEQALDDHGIPYLVRGAERFYERPEVRQALLTLRTESRTAAAGEDESPIEQVKAVFGALGWTAVPPKGAGAARERWESLAALISVAEELGREAGIDLAAISAELDRRATAQQVPSAHGVTVATLHSAKGLEWDAVAVVGAQEGSLPFVLATTPAEIEEERRLFYVGITRAREHLRISWARSRAGSTSTRKPSRFLDQVRTPRGAPTALVRPRTGRSRSSVLTVTCRSCGHHLLDASERKLGRHNSCPSTFDEHTLALLKEWRVSQAAEESLPAYCIFTDATLIAIAEARPQSRQDLIKIHGLGQAKATKYGDAVLKILG